MWSVFPLRHLLFAMLWLALAQAALVQAQPPHSGRKSKPAEVAPLVEKQWTHQVVVSRMDQPSARDAALDKAEDDIVDYLQAHQPPIEWPEARTYIRQHLTAEKDSWIQKTEYQEDNGKPPIGTLTMTIELSRKDYEQMLKLDRQYRAQHRQWALVKFVGGLVLLLAGVAGYLRLTQTKKQESKRWFRLAAVGVAGLAGAAWWLL